MTNAERAEGGVRGNGEGDAKPKAEVLRRLVEPGLVAVVRAPRSAQVLPLAEALVAGGVSAVEVTLTTPNAFEAIAEARRQFGARALIGVGTVLDAFQCRDALAAGAEFVVTPILRTELVEVAHAAGRPIMLGAFTPTEAQRAHEAGADFVKLFPADTLGPGYVRAIRAPLPHLRIVPTGGVDLNTAGAFLDAGCAALGVGSSLLTREILERDDWSALRELAGRYAAVVREWRRCKTRAA